MARAVLIFTYIPKYKYILVKSILCVAIFVRTTYAQIFVQVRFINEAPGEQCVDVAKGLAASIAHKQLRSGLKPSYSQHVIYGRGGGVKENTD